MGTVAAALLASGLLDERRTVARQQSGVSAIETIAKAMEGVTHPDAPAWIAVAQDGRGHHGGFWTCAAATDESPRYIRADIYASLARQAEALQRENAELREALKPFATHIEEMKFDVDNNGVPLPDDQAVGWVYVTNGDFRRARALLGGENAGN